MSKKSPLYAKCKCGKFYPIIISVLEGKGNPICWEAYCKKCANGDPLNKIFFRKFKTERVTKELEEVLGTKITKE